MFLRAIAFVTGVIELLAPRKLVDFWMGLAADGDYELKPWVYTAARLEGVVLVLWALKGCCSRSSE
ncbi:hypothetical protein [Halobellus captivus]|uniref:hypothetical protein n=1 Tax=Halobellus captivus TaxID=2592614 RepID=UPI00119E830C|nr:hypothetical protein [Halobellus captivus]